MGRLALSLRLNFMVGPMQVDVVENQFLHGALAAQQPAEQGVQHAA